MRPNIEVIIVTKLNTSMDSDYRVRTWQSFIPRAIEPILSANQIMTHDCAVVGLNIDGKFADPRGDTQLHNEYVLFRKLPRLRIFKCVCILLQEVCIFRVALALAPPCRFCYSYLLFHALLTFYAACPSPAEPPLKYHVENNSLSNSHFPLRGWFRRNMHETEASEVKMEKKRWCDEKFGDS